MHRIHKYSIERSSGVDVLIEVALGSDAFMDQGGGYVLCRRQANVLRLFSGCQHAHPESAVGSAAMRSLRRADLGTEEIAYRAAQNLSSLRRAPTVPRNRAANVRATEAT